ncbi:hypothetical protein RGQ29_015282 [Quercus rubra]|uniref:Uncharacterized protein n=1 Tax=Quercus rubra TaxID=3512 RepID=A0AAN7J457_QUERU|nr:hypothetical protein RGQ29_015282 [Quercus rubra]
MQTCLHRLVGKCSSPGSKEEVYFDLQSCLESDCEDFFSDSGGKSCFQFLVISANTTPSCGNTPIHHCGFKDTPHVKKPVYMDSCSSPILEPSPTDMKKQLIELFQESFRDDAIEAVKIYEAIHNRSYNHGKGKFAKSARCCLPNLMRALVGGGRG